MALSTKEACRARASVAVDACIASTAVLARQGSTLGSVVLAHAAGEANGAGAGIAIDKVQACTAVLAGARGTLVHIDLLKTIMMIELAA